MHKSFFIKFVIDFWTCTKCRELGKRAGSKENKMNTKHMRRCGEMCFVENPTLQMMITSRSGFRNPSFRKVPTYL